MSQATIGPKSPAVTVIMPTYNSLTRFDKFNFQETLSRALKSLLTQDYPNFKIFVLDNCSEDKTFDYLQSIQTQYPNKVSVFQDSKKRLTEESIQKLAEMVDSEFLVVANDDDLWEPKFLSQLVKVAIDNPQYDLYIPKAFAMDIKGNEQTEITSNQFLESVLAGKETNYLLQSYFYNRCSISLLFGLFRTTAYKSAFPLSSIDGSTTNVDNRFMMQFLFNKSRIYFHQEKLFFYRDRPRPLGNIKPFKADSDEKEVNKLILSYLLHQFAFLDLVTKILLEYEDFSDCEKNIIFISFTFSSLCHFEMNVNWLLKEYISNSKIKSKIKLFHESIEEMLYRYPAPRSGVSINKNFVIDSKYILNQPMIMKLLVQPLIETIITISNWNENAQIEDQKSLGGSELNIVINKLETILNSSNVLAKEPYFRNSNQDSHVTVISCSYNLAKYADHTTKSINNQRNVRVDHLVADGGSSDDSLSIFAAYDKTKVVSTQDKGYIDGFWKAFEHVKSSYLAQCCISDSYANLNWLQIATTYLNENPEISLVWGFPQYMEEDGSEAEISYPDLYFTELPSADQMYKYWIETGFFFPEGNFVARKEVFKYCLPNLQESKNCEPFLEFTSRFHQNGFLSAGIPLVANFGRRHPGQMSEEFTKSGSMKKFVDNYHQQRFEEKKKLLNSGSKSFNNLDGQIVKVVEFSKRDFINQSSFTYFFNLGRKLFLKIPVKSQLKIRSLLYKSKLAKKILRRGGVKV